MITGPRSHFEARLRERGYTLDEVRACIVLEDGDMVTVDETHPAYPRQAKPGVTVQGSAGPADAPGFLQKVKNFASSAAKHIASGMPAASDEEIERRFAICQTCPFLVNGACAKCGCPVNRERGFISKLSWANESCPVGKWGPVGQ